MKAEKDLIGAAAGLWNELKGTGREFERRRRRDWKRRTIQVTAAH